MEELLLAVKIALASVMYLHGIILSRFHVETGIQLV